MIYAYLRVSTTNQDEENQRVGVDNKAASLGYHPDTIAVLPKRLQVLHCIKYI